MIFWFSGTGNSRFVAEEIGKVLGETPVSVNDSLKAGKAESYTSETPFVFVTPTYAWRIPYAAADWIRRTVFLGSRAAYFVMTCGDGAGNAAKYIEMLCAEKGFTFQGMRAIVMPENYIAMFAAPDLPKARQIIEKARPVIAETARCIAQGAQLPPQKISLMDQIYSQAANPLFYRLFVSAKGFYTTEACVACGKCAEVCPMNNITLQDGKPVWSNRCTHCMACICRCPKEAIEYKKKSKGQPRYTAEKTLK